MGRIWAVAVALGALTTGGIVIDPAGAGAAPVSVRVSPATNLEGGRTVTLSGRGLVQTYRGAPQTWFATECTSAVRGHLKPATDTPHCDITHAVAIRVARDGAFAAHYRVISGIVGDGYCGTAGHLSCVIGVGTAQGLGTVVRISFKAPPASGSANH